MRAIRVTEAGGPDVLRVADVPDPEPGPGDALVRVERAGVNFIDVYHRTGLYPRNLPFTPGQEGAGVVEALGDDVVGIDVGDRVAWAMSPDSYAERVAVPAWKLVRLPARVSFDLGAALMLQGMTAHYLVRSTRPLGADDVALVHAAAGGVGLLLVQLAKRQGATVIGTCSTEEKAERVRAAGADHVIRYTETPFQPEVMRLTDGLGASVVYDSVGRTTFRHSLDSLRPRGYLVLFGQSSGKVEPFDPARLAAGGSLFLTRPSLADYAADREEVEWRGGELLALVEAGSLDVRVHDVLALDDAPRAHRMLEGRETSGKVLLAL
ncbi:MAG TPA: quinone oxidoreductase [Longimicrobiales bacterium]|nr:quinone oxidoreductase [Longimicrobiales bacterium]